ncbi:hypothetical protein V2O64_11365 [Verrucomicrobiaceae bacterium 227]
MHPLSAALLASLGAPVGAPWVLWQELKVRSKGSPLTRDIQNWAENAGVQNVEKIRMTYAKVIPLPAPMFVRKHLGKRGFPSTDIAGLALRYGIYLEEGTPLNGSVIRHELIHTRQYQRVGSVLGFLWLYLYQCLTTGYYDCALEKEARDDSASS